MRKILRRPKLPDLSKYKDVADYVMGGGGASDSEADDMEDAKVEIAAGNRAIEGRHGARPSKEAEEAAVKLQQCRRVVLFRRDPESGQFDLRHYVINVKAAGLRCINPKP